MSLCLSHRDLGRDGATLKVSARSEKKILKFFFGLGPKKKRVEKKRVLCTFFFGRYPEVCSEIREIFCDFRDPDFFIKILKEFKKVTSLNQIPESLA